MSLNDFFASGVYLRPVGLPDCFSIPGLPHGCKPPPPPPPPQLAMQHPCGAAPPQKPRSMATVSPLHQVTVPQQANHLGTAFEPPPAALNAFGPAASAANRTSSFAAALRKLAKQAGDPVVGEKDLTQISPVSSPVLAQRSLTPKRNSGTANGQSAMYLTSGGVNNNAHQITSYPSGSPPVVTIAPSRPHQTHTSDARKLQVMDLSGLPQGTAPSGLTNGHLSDSLNLKLDSNNKSSSRPNPNEKWEDHHVSKSLPTSSASSQSRPHATIAPLPRPDDSLTSSRGFQPYRSAEDIRTTMPHHLSPFEHHPPSAYPYTPAFLPPPHIPHPAYRFEDPIFLDRYGLLRSSVMPFPSQSGMMAGPAAFYPQSRYDLLAQSLSLSSAANNSLLHHERLKMEEERRLREKENELDQSRKREQERREKEHREKEHREKESKKEKSHRERVEKHNNTVTNDKQHHSDDNRLGNHLLSHSKKAEHSSSRNNAMPNTVTTITTTTTTTVNTTINGHHPASSPLSNNNNNNNNNNNGSTPLNLVVHPSVEQPRKESELWMPWQQHHQTSNHHSSNQVKDNQEENGNGFVAYRHSSIAVPDNYKAAVTKESTSPEKFHQPYNQPYYNDKRHLNADVSVVENDTKKHSHHSNGNTKKLDSIHHHITELSKKDSNSVNPNEWKHEKLQKLCTNNHRKSSNEFKKLRDETHQNHQRKQHQQQQHPSLVNGVVKPSSFHPVQSPDEGMHARLLETEKCRMSEYNSLPQQQQQPPQQQQHTSIKPMPTNQASDKTLLPPVHMLNNFQMNGHDVLAQKMYMDYNYMSVLNHAVETVPLRSKLDKEAEDMKKKGKSDLDVEDAPMNDFLIVSKGPPLKLDTNPKKLKFLKLMGLTTHLKRKKIELDMYLKRRKLLHEDYTSTNTIPLEEPPKNSVFLWQPSHDQEVISERLRVEAKSEKIEFLKGLGLKHLTLTMKTEQFKFRKIVTEERQRREQRLMAKTDKPLVFKSKDERGNHESKVKLTGDKSKEETKLDVDTCSSQNSFAPGEQDKPAIIKTEIKTDCLTHMSTGIQVDLPFTCKSLSDKKDKNQRMFQWPGLDVIMEAYYRHNKEQLHEKEIIHERCNRLKQQQEELKKEANNLNKTMAELLKLKHDLDEKRSQYDTAIERLKQCIQLGR